MPIIQPTVGLCSYGTVRWPADTRTTSFSADPEYDSAGRTVIYTRYRITLRAVYPGRAVDEAVRRLVQTLNRPAQAFTYSGIGCRFVVNVGRIRDAKWGPRPISCTIDPMGGGNSVVVTWTVEACVPDCDDAIYRFAGMEFNYTLDYQIDASGYTTRTYAGFLRVPMTRLAPGDRRLPDNIDEYREDVYPPLITNFRPGTRTWKLNEAKDRIDFSVTDEQMPPNIPPAGMITAEASHTFASSPGNFLQWTGTTEATYEIGRNGATTADFAAEHFLRLLKDRVDFLRARIAAGLVRPGPTPVVLPVSFSFAEPQIYGRTTARFQCVYMVNAADLKSMLASGGLWRPTPRGSDWIGWRMSLAPVFGARGHGGLRFGINDDAIVDLCRATNTPQLIGTGPGGTLPGGGAPGPPGAPGGGGPPGGGPGGAFPTPTPATSWARFWLKTYLETDNGIVPVQGLPIKPRKSIGDLYGGPAVGGSTIGTALGTIPGVIGALTNPQQGSKSPQKLTPAEKDAGGFLEPQEPQRRARQTAVLHLIGGAVRVGFTIPAPEVVSWGGAKLTPANRLDKGEGFFTSVVGNMGWPVVSATWHLRYVLDTIPSGTAPAVSNPLFGV